METSRANGGRSPSGGSGGSSVTQMGGSGGERVSPHATMKAALWYGPEEVRVEEVEVPEVGPGEVLVKIGVALTCGTDFKLFRRGPALLVKNRPSPFGHEMAGTIAAVGPGVSGF